MLLDVDFAYAANFRKRPARNFNDGYLVSTVPVAVAEVTSDQAPVVLRYPYHGENKTHDADVKWVEVREYDGMLLHLLDDPEIPRPDGDLAWIERAAKDRGVRDGMDRGPFSIAYRHAGKERDDDKAVDVASSERDKTVAALLERARGFVLVDGRVWRTLPEPKLVLVIDYDRDKDEMVVKSRVRREEYGVEPSASYRLDQGAVLAAQHAGIFGHRDRVRFDYAEVEILDGSGLRLRADEIHLHHVGKRLVDGMKRSLPEAQVPYMLAYVRLRDATEAYGAALEADGPCDSDDYVSALSEAASVGEPDDVLSGHARAACRRYEISNEDRVSLVGFSP